MLKFFRIPFGTSGDRTAVPDAVDSNGYVSYTQGYGPDYQRQKTDPASKNIERDKMNEIFFDMTTAIAELQAQGIPDFITTALNGGTAYSYAQYAVVRYSGDLYISLVGTNTALPSDATKWALLPTPGRIQAAAYTSASAGGTANALTASFAPAIAAWPVSGTLEFLVRASTANTSTTPTFSPNGLSAVTIVKNNNVALAPGDIPGAGAWLHLAYDPTLGKVVLLNPATSAGGNTVTSPVNTNGAGLYVLASGLPATVNAFDVRMDGVSINSNNNFQIQVSDGGTYKTAGYGAVSGVTNSAGASYSTGIVIPTSSSLDTLSGAVQIKWLGFNGSAHSYAITGVLSRTGGTVAMINVCGSFTTTNRIDGLRFNIVTPGDLFDGGWSSVTYG